MKKIKNIICKIIYILKKKEKIPILIPVKEFETFAGKIALISGGSGGIGKEIAKKLLQGGCKVIIAGSNQENLNMTVMELGEQNITSLVLNIADTKSFKDKVNEAWHMFSERKIDILINCAGVNDSNSFLDVTEDIYDKIMNINAKGTYFLSQMVAKQMIKNNIHGHILNLSSSSALRPASTPYIISKWAISGMTKGMADVLLKYGIIVNAIAPGPVATNMVGKTDISEISHISSPCGRYALPSEIANLAVYMVSGYGDLIVGDTFYITGGSGTIDLHK